MCEIKNNPYKGYIEKLKEPIELKGRVIKYKPVAKLSGKKAVQKGGLQDFFNFCIRLPYEEYLKNYTIISMIKDVLKIDCDIDINREIFNDKKLLILVKVFPKTFSNNSNYILVLKKKVMDKFIKHFKDAQIFDCGIPSAPPLNNQEFSASAQSININQGRAPPFNNNKNKKEIKISFLTDGSKLNIIITNKIRGILNKIFNKFDISEQSTSIDSELSYLIFRGFTNLKKNKIEEYIEEINKLLETEKKEYKNSNKLKVLSEVIGGILIPKVTEIWKNESGKEIFGDLRNDD